MPRLYRDAPLNSIWEGSGNVTALDLLRALARSPGGIEALRAELSQAAGADRQARCGRAAAVGRCWPRSPPTRPPGLTRARALAGLLTLVMQAALLVRFAPAPVSDAFCASRLAGRGGAGGPGVTFGTLPPGLDLAAIADRTRPEASSRPQGPRPAAGPQGPRPAGQRGPQGPRPAAGPQGQSLPGKVA